jgi:hypothetical protein
MVAGNSSETTVNNYQLTQHCIPKNSDLLQEEFIHSALYGVIFSCYAHTQTCVSVAMNIIKLSHVSINYSIKPKASGEKHDDINSEI